MKKKILLIDDDRLVLTSIEKLILSKGYEVRSYQSPVEALKAFSDQEFDLVISDIRMSGQDGIETVRGMRQIEEEQGRSQTPIIMMTGYASEDAPVQAIKTGVQDYFLKPLDNDELLKSIEFHLEKRYKIIGIESTDSIAGQTKAHSPERRLASRPELLSRADFRHFARTVLRSARSVSRIGIRQASSKDLPELLKVEKVAWPEEARASKEMLASRIEIFPEGVLCATVNGTIVGFSCWELIAQTPDKIHDNWSTLTDWGFIRKTHTPNGSTLFGVSLSILPQAPRDTAFAIAEATKKIAIRKELSWVALGSRIPGFHRVASKMNVGKYIRQFRLTGKHFDPELDLYKRMGMALIRPIPDFFPDPLSCNFGALLAWKNPLKEIPDQLNLWDEYRWFTLWTHKARRRQESWQI